MDIALGDRRMQRGTEGSKMAENNRRMERKNNKGKIKRRIERIKNAERNTERDRGGR